MNEMGNQSLLRVFFVSLTLVFIFLVITGDLVTAQEVCGLPPCVEDQLPPVAAVPEGNAFTVALFVGTGLYLLWRKGGHDRAR